MRRSAPWEACAWCRSDPCMRRVTNQGITVGHSGSRGRLGGQVGSPGGGGESGQWARCVTDLAWRVAPRLKELIASWHVRGEARRWLRRILLGRSRTTWSGDDWAGRTSAWPTSIGQGRRTNRLLLQPSDTNEAMSLSSSIVKEIFSLLNLELPWRRAQAVLVSVLLVFGCIDRADLTKGLTAWVQEEACRYDRAVSSAVSEANMPKVAVVSTPRGCIVLVVDQQIDRRG